MDQTKALALKQKQEGVPPRLLLDISNVTKQDSGARSAAKEIRDFKLEKIAVFGGSRILKMIGQYILRSGNMASYSRIFNSRRPAIQWLGEKQSHNRSKHVGVFWVCLGIGLSLALLGFVSWATGNPIFFNIGSIHRAMNPVTALSLILIACAAIQIKVGTALLWQRTIIIAIAMWSIVFGIAVFLRFTIALDMHFDTWLFSEQLASAAESARTSAVAGLLVLALGTALLLLWQKRIQKWQEIVLYVVSLTMLLVPLLIITGYSFGITVLYAPHGTPPTTLLTALSSLSLAIGLLVLNASRRSGSKTLRSLLARFWQGLFVFITIILLTGFVWQQSRHGLSQTHTKLADESFGRTTNLISNRIEAYIDALQGYKAFFAASGKVEPNEFRNYYQTSQLAQRYPGITAVTVVRNIPKDQHAQFTASIRKDFSSVPEYRSYAIFPQTNSADTFPLIFLESATGSRASLGYDLSSEPERRTTLQRARDAGSLKATGQINLYASRPEHAPENGFFITVPIYNQINGKDPVTVADRRKQIYGMVNAVVNDNRLFSDVFKNVRGDDLRYTIAAGGIKVFETSPQNDKHTLAKSQTVSILDQQWTIQMFADPNYGISTTQQLVPYSMLAGGFILAFLSALLVVSQTRRREQALQLASSMTEDLQLERNAAVTLQQKDEAILSSIGDAVFAIDTKGIITLLNPAAEHISGITAAEAIGRPYHEILEFQFEATGKQNDAFIREALRGKVSSMKNHTVLIRKDGVRVAVADSAAPIYDNSGIMQGVIVVFRDVSKEYELDKAKTEFVSLASHQLRTPLSAINWYAELLLGGDAGKLPKDAEEYVREIYEGNQRMIELVNSLLDVSRLELGKLAYNPEPTNMTELARSLQKELETSIMSKDITFKSSIAKVLPTVEGDPKQLRMIIQNLLSNAIKYSPAHSNVELEMRPASAREIKEAGLRATDSLFLRVTDAGYGIPKVQQSKIFSKLFRADNVRALDVEGTGLGLYIVKEVVSNMGGKVWFESIESAGTTFYVILPFKPKKAKQTRS